MRSNFIGRENELNLLQRLLTLDHAALVVINGRRRIGKSRLVNEFAKDKSFYTFTGLAPHPKLTAQQQRNEFARQLAEQFHIPDPRADSWGRLFTLLAKKTENGEHIIFFDEISWMALDEPDFLGTLKIVWDTHFKKNNQLLLILCGSISSWIEKNILSNTGFLGRPTLHLKLDELSLPQCNEFWGAQQEHVSSYEKLKLLAITGGVPRYLELIDPNLTAEENINFLCFIKDAPLFKEFERIFSDIYGKRSKNYRELVQALSQGTATQEALSQKLKFSRGNDFSQYLDDLVAGGFISRDYTWNISTGKISKLSRYRLKDCYSRFYLKYIAPNEPQIEKGNFNNRSLTTLPHWYSLLGFQFENLVLNNHHAILRELNIPLEDLVFDNPFLQRKTQRQPGCQIDYMVQTRHDTLYVCEIKFSRNEIKKDIVEEVQKKINQLKTPRNFSRRPVLIHVNGVHEAVLDSQYFSHIIDFGDLLKKQ